MNTKHETCACCGGKLAPGETYDVAFLDGTAQSCYHCHEELEEHAREAWQEVYLDDGSSLEDCEEAYHESLTTSH